MGDRFDHGIGTQLTSHSRQPVLTGSKLGRLDGPDLSGLARAPLTLGEVIPDQSFGRKRKLPPLRWDQHAVPRMPANPLAEHGLQPSSPLSASTESTLPDHPLPRRSVRISERAPPPPAEPWQPPGRPPDMELRSSSPGAPDLDLIPPQYDLRQLERWALGLTQTEPE